MLGSMSSKGSLGSPQFGTATLSPLQPNAGSLASVSNSNSDTTTPWTAGGVVSEGGYGNFKGVHDPPEFVQQQSQSVVATVPIEMALSPPRSELDGGGGGRFFDDIASVRMRGPPAQQPVIMEVERSMSVRSLEGRKGWGVGASEEGGGLRG